LSDRTTGAYTGHSDNDSFYIAEESKVTLLHSLGKNTVQSITVKTLPQKTTYLIGEKPDYKGLVITAKYKDGTTKDVSKGYSASSAALETLGTQKITITYEKQSTTIDLKVNPIEVSSVSVNSETLTLIAGETKKLSAGIAPSNATDKKVSVTSSDSSVVKAEGLTLTALNAGTAKITVKAHNGKSAVCTVTVVLPEVSSVSLSSSEMYLTAGESRKLTATVLPQNAGNKAVAWTSSNTNAASVDSSGNVTAIATGSAVITAKTSNGKTASCTVYVSVPVTGVTIPTQIAMKSGETHQLKATVSPANASDQTLIWTSSNTKVATVDTSGKVTAIASGTAVITVQTNNGKTAACTATVTTPLESISLPEDEFTGQVGKTYSITPIFVPSNADDRSFTVKVSDSTVLSVKDNKFTALKAGTATLTVTTPNGKSDSCKVTILGEAELTLIKKPSKTTYYIGDSLDTSGLKLGYTDTAGNYIELTKGFTISGGDTSSSGTQTVKVKYNDLSVKFDITVKTPSITINKLPIEGTVLLAVQTEPEDQKFDIWSSDPDVFVVASYLGASYIAQPTGEGTAEACVSMEYNGIEYTDYVSITSIAQNYDFELWADDCGDGEWVCGIETNIPGFDIRNVKWSTNAAEHWTDDNGYFRVWSKETIYVTASYVHNGKEYSDNCTIKIEVREYSFQIVRNTNSIPGERGIYYITTDIKNKSFQYVTHVPCELTTNGAVRVNLYQTATVTARSGLTIRRSPDINSSSVGTLASGATVNVCHAPLTDNSGYEWRRLVDGRGWVCSSYLNITSGQFFVSGNYKIQGANGKYLSYVSDPNYDVNIVMYEDLSGYDISDLQIWNFQPLAYFNDSGAVVYKITPVLNSSYALDCDSGNNELLHLWENLDIAAQQWIVEVRSDGSLRILNNATRYALDIASASNANNAEVITYPSHDENNQKFYIVVP